MNNGNFSSEAVSCGHPDKVADRISDEIVDACLRQNPKARVAVETLVTAGNVILAGEVSGVSAIDYDGITRAAIRDIGYLSGNFAADDVKVQVLVHEQSPEIATAVNTNGTDEGAGDQGLMFGYATSETESCMPLALSTSHALLEELTRLRKDGATFLGPDAKSQVTVTYVNGVPTIARVVVSHQHSAGRGGEATKLIRDVVERLAPKVSVVDINPSGSFVSGGPGADTGLTGRKIIVDTYGGSAPHGGGAFSGKDPTKVDRSAAYMARWVAKNIVGAGLADRCLVQVAYLIGKAEPASFHIDTFGTSVEPTWVIQRAIDRCVSFKPKDIRERLRLERPIYARTASGGHFGRAPQSDGGFIWEDHDLEELLLEMLP